MKVNTRVVFKRQHLEPDEDFGASGLVLEDSHRRFGPWIKDVFYYMGEIKEFPEWCVISTTKNKQSGTKDFMVRKDCIKKYLSN